MGGQHQHLHQVHLASQQLHLHKAVTACSIICFVSPADMEDKLPILSVEGPIPLTDHSGIQFTEK